MDSSQDKQLPASERRLNKAREDGQVTRSRDLSHLAVLGIGGLAMMALAPHMFGQFLEDMGRSGEDDDGFLDRHVADNDADPLNLLGDQRLRQALVAAIKTLPEREQFVMSMYYEQDMNLKEIAAVLNITESRVCQLHSQSVARLRAKMRAH